VSTTVIIVAPRLPLNVTHHHGSAAPSSHRTEPSRPLPEAALVTHQRPPQQGVS